MVKPDKDQANSLSRGAVVPGDLEALLDETERSVERYLAMLAELRVSR